MLQTERRVKVMPACEKSSFLRWSFVLRENTFSHAYSPEGKIKISMKVPS
jgi:hypothetical protein